MYFRRFIIVVAALAASCGVQAKSAKPVLAVDTRRHAAPRFDVSPKSAVAKSSPSAVVRGGVVPNQKAAVVLGLILALNSGFINGCCLSGAITADGAKQAVAAVTASWTNSAMGLASGNMKQFSFLSQVIGAFMGGSAIAGLLNPRPTPFQVTTSAYALPLSIGGVLLAIASQLIKKMDTVKLGFLLCAMANGIQNSMTSTMTGNLCRTSHYSGITSDMGTFLGQILAGNKANMYKLKIFMALSLCFWAGGFISYGIGKEYGSTSLLFAAGLYAVIIALYESFAKNL